MSDDRNRSHLRNKIALELVVEKTVDLKAEPPNLRGSCPLHPDHSRGLYVQGGRFHCFSCGRGGDVVDWTAITLGVSRSEATKHLSDMLGQPDDFG